MKIIKSYLTKNDCYKQNKKMEVKGLMIHSVGCSQPNANVFINLWNKSNVPKCVHAFIEPDNVYQTLDWNVQGWHAGKSKGNSQYVGVELTEPSCIKYEGNKIVILDNVEAEKHIHNTYNNAVKLFAKLCNEYNLNPYTDVVSHKEGYQLGIASNHGDPEHLWNLFGLTMSGFRNDINNALKKPFLVKVITNTLNVRKEPKIENNVVMEVNKDEVYTIVETDNGWGKLKSGVGWIKITDKYCKLL